MLSLLLVSLVTLVVDGTAINDQSHHLAHVFEGFLTYEESLLRPASFPVQYGTSNVDYVFVEDDVIAPKLHRKRRQSLPRVRLWPDATIPYTFTNDYSERDRSLIDSSLQEIEQKTCLKFRRMRGGGNNRGYVTVANRGGCFSYVGILGRSQVLSLGRGCLTRSIIQHEFMHAAGLYHEHNRPDRDQYITVNWHNISPGGRRSYQKFRSHQVQQPPEPYDLYSTMHYKSGGFGTGGGPTMTAKQGGHVGSRNRLTDLDIDKMMKLYNCRDRPTGKPTRPTGGPTRPTGGPTTPTGGPTRPTTRRPRRCRDYNRNCAAWARRNYCSTSRYMKKYCKKSCHIC